MKIFSFLVLTLIFNSIFSIERYYLTNGTEFKVESLKSSNIYDFYINATYYQIENIELGMNDMDPVPFSSLIVYEYSNTEEHLKNLTIPVKLIKNNSELTASFYYSAQEIKTTFLVFRIEPTENMDYFKIKIDIGNTDYDISDGVVRNITNLKGGVYYHFFTPINTTKSCSINITLNCAESEYCSKVLIFTSEYSDRKTPNGYYHAFDYPLSQSDPRILHIYDIIGYNTEYLDFALNAPLSDINYLVIQMDISYDITLKKGREKKRDFDYNYPYNFFISTTLLEKNSITLTLDHISEEPFKYIYIREYSIGIAGKEGNSTITYPAFTKKNVGSNLVLNCTYIVSNGNTEYISLSLKFNDFEITVIEANIDINGGAINLNRHWTQNITNLLPEYSYYLFIESHNFQAFNLTMNYSSSDPISSVNIQEYSEQNVYNLLREKYQNISSIIHDNEFMTSLRYFIKEEYNDTKYTAIVINPSYQIDYLLTKLEFFEYKYELSEGLISHLYNLEPEYKYYFYIPIQENERKIKVDISVTNIYDKPLSQITILDQKRNDSINSYENKEDVDLTNIEYTSDLTISHITVNSDIKTVVFIIKLKYYVDHMWVNFHYSIYLSTGIIILIVSISSIFFISIVVAIIFIIKKCRGVKVPKEMDSSNNEQLISDNQTKEL